MNKDFAFFDVDTGLFAHIVNMPEDDVNIQEPQFIVVPIDLSTFVENSYWDVLTGTIVNLPDRPTEFHLWNNTKKKWEDPRNATEKLAYLEEIKANQLWLINRQFEVACKKLTETYPETEKITWSIQQSEAFAWYADNSAQTPFLATVAANREIDLDALRQKTYEKVQQFQQYSAALIGKRQKYEDAIYAASTEAAVKLINWE